MSCSSEAANFSAMSVAIPERPDLGWIRAKVPIEEVARELGLEVTRHRARCWRPEDHRNWDANPSLRFFVRKNRVRCFVCDMKGGHSNIDLVMGVLGCDFSSAVHWICERFPVPETRPGRPLGSRSAQQPQYRVGVSGSDLETLVRSGLWAQLSSSEVRILPVLYHFRDPDTGLTTMSYRAIMRYAGVGSDGSVSKALSHLQRIHAIQKSRGPRFGITRDCSTYRVTLGDEKLLQLSNETYKKTREEGAAERAFRSESRVAREKEAAARRLSKLPSSKIAGPSLQDAVTYKGGLRPPAPPASCSVPETSSATPLSCKGLNLSSPSEAQTNKSLQLVKREIRTGIQQSYDPPDEAECMRRAQEQKADLDAWLASREEGFSKPPDRVNNETRG